MRKSLLASAMFLLFASSAFAEYIVVLKDGRRYVAKQKWTVVDGKAIVELTTGSRLSINLSQIDAAASERATNSGLGDATVLQTTQATQQKAPQKSALGSLATIRKGTDQTASKAPVSPTPSPLQSGRIEPDVEAKFTAAFENVGLYERRLAPAGPGKLRIDVTADNEDHVFKAISATSFIFANVPSQYSEVELYLRTSSGGSAGRFQMTRDQATALANKQMEWYDYYVRHVIF